MKSRKFCFHLREDRVEKNGREDSFKCSVRRTLPANTNLEIYARQLAIEMPNIRYPYINKNVKSRKFVVTHVEEVVTVKLKNKKS